ncbi:outer dense fiber protein 3-like isoform X1 [Daphnia pulex]|uniref:outer dense fiber protein 3-like isoform X1 n=1 Tax=Daphnia pulex TaxID=6669 RepID=UPI001EDD05D8|nr:outer dense fiber protein 3-like isoform X1 [Daphnia pulex]XP_046436855.1 outer dense fiber protein 3-like isoform X1 [Daphnia pulex]
MSPALVNGSGGGGGGSTGALTLRRGPIAAEFQGPGPAAVALPSTIGKSTSESTKGRAPAFSFGIRHNPGKTSLGPGPGQYNVARLHHKGKDDGPAPSISGRPKESRHDITPAPGDYNPEKGGKFVGESSPSFTFGAKVKDERKDNLPAPNAYSLPPALGTGLAPAFSISGRGKSPIDERVLNPGPGAYESGNQDKYKARSPSYSISSRTNIPTDQTQKPGPGAHSPEKIKQESSPAHTFGMKHSPYLGKLKGL